jgi:hypothetical protein
MGGFWSIFSNQTFRISYWNIVEQFKTLRNGVGLFEKSHYFHRTPYLDGGGIKYPSILVRPLQSHCHAAMLQHHLLSEIGPWRWQGELDVDDGDVLGQ